MNENLKFCKHCGEKIPYDAVICTKCGRQVESMDNPSAQPKIVINNSSSSSAAASSAAVGGYGSPKNKWTAFFLCLFLGIFGAHKFYEERTGMGILYIFTGGLFFVGWIVDIIALLCKPNPYYVY